MKDIIFRFLISILICITVAHASYGQKNIEIFFFLEPECPISQQYSPFLRTFYTEEVDSKDIQDIQLIFSSVRKKGFSRGVKSFLHTYQLNIPYKIDWNHHLARTLQATVTPEVFLLVDGKVTYHGAIDNMYAKLGIKRLETNEHYLKASLQALRNHLPPPYTFKEPMGCFIEY